MIPYLFQFISLLNFWLLSIMLFTNALCAHNAIMLFTNALCAHNAMPLWCDVMKCFRNVFTILHSFPKYNSVEYSCQNIVSHLKMLYSNCSLTGKRKAEKIGTMIGIEPASLAYGADVLTTAPCRHKRFSPSHAI